KIFVENCFLIFNLFKVVGRKVQETCSNTQPCNVNAGLRCVSGKCACPANQFFDGSKCGKLRKL
ncbi:hypothetical protein V6O07_11615, partial [Arthrospira platensis SPKY2]